MTLTSVDQLVQNLSPILKLLGFIPGGGSPGSVLALLLSFSALNVQGHGLIRVAETPGVMAAKQW
jgi:hypothetical protein